MWNDFRFALRTLGRAPAFTAVAVLSLALGIGANAAIFSLLYQVVLRSVPVKDPAELVALQSDDYNPGWTRRDNNQGSVFSYPMYQALRDHNQAFTGLIARASFPATLVCRGEAVRADAEVVTGNFFTVLGLNPALGRLLLPSDDGAPGQNPVIVLSHSFWVSHLGADPKVLNSQVVMNGHPVVVVGVSPRGFRGLLSGRDPDFYAAVSMAGMVSPEWQMIQAPDSYWLNLFGRLRPGVSAQRANAMLLPLFRAVLRDELPRMKNAGTEKWKKILDKPLTVQSGAQGLNVLRDQWQTPLVVLMVMVGLVLLLACANVANLLIARATARQREVAVRLAIGATAWQLARQLMVESTVIALAGGFFGLLLSQGFAGGLLRLLPAGATGGWLAPRVDLPLIACCTALSLATALLFAFAPFVQVSKTDLAPVLKDQTSGMSASGSQSRARQSLVAGQICISLLLLLGAGLFTRNLVELAYADPGFRPDHLVTFSIDPTLSGYTPEQRLAITRELREKLRALPGVKSVARAYLLPFGGSGWGNGVKVPGSRNASKEYVDCGENAVGAGYFSMLGTPLLAGREFREQDSASAPKVAILNQTFARFLFENENPIGRHMRVGSNDSDVEVVGVVQDSKYGDLREKPQRFLYVPFKQGADALIGQSAFLLRVQGGEEGIFAAVRSTVKQLDANLPIDRLTSMTAVLDDSIYSERLIATLALAFGVLATMLAAVGVYGTISYAVERRTREFGIRLVLGAIPSRILLSVIGDVGRLAAVGIAVGLPVGYALARIAASRIPGIRAYDPWMLAAATAVIAMVALLAAVAPALRAMRIEPVRALRYE